jgi:hypothetical protein
MKRSCVDGRQGNHVAQLDAGHDVYQWDGSDIVEGGLGQDVLSLHGSTGRETFDVAATGSPTRPTRDLGDIAMDLSEMERVDVFALDGLR